MLATFANVSSWAAGQRYEPAAVNTFLQQADYYLVGQALALGYTVVTHEIPSTIQMMLRMVEDFVPRLLPMNWSIELDDTERLITSDTPVVIWHKRSRMDEFEGVGIDNAAVLRFPLDPGKQLVISKRRRPRVILIEPHRVRRSNADMADGCHRFIVGCPVTGQALDSIRLESCPPAVRFNVAPLIVEDSDGRKVRDSEVMHMFVPRRPMKH